MRGEHDVVQQTGVKSGNGKDFKLTGWVTRVHLTLQPKTQQQQQRTTSHLRIYYYPKQATARIRCRPTRMLTNVLILSAVLTFVCLGERNTQAVQMTR